MKPLSTGIRVATVLASLLLAAAPARAAERKPSPEMTALRQSIADLTIELEQLQTEVRELRGQIEVQTHELDTLKSRNRETLADMDKRLREAERRASSSVATPPSAPADGAAVTGNEQQEYEAAFALLKQGNYERASNSLREFLVKYPKSELAANAQYWIGASQYEMRNYKQAVEEFGKIVDKYPSSPKMADALLRLGYSHHELGALDKARETLQQVITRFPNTAQAKSAEIRLTEVKAAEAKAKPKPKPPAKSAPKKS
jgi:tol-pal system protein YbgF